MTQRPVVCAIAGSDPSGGAGIQADSATVRASGGYPLTVVTALTVQSTLGVSRVSPLPLELVLGQLDALLDDCRIDAVKIGMLGAAEVLPAVLDRLERRLPPGVPIVLDPVLRASSGAALADAGGDPVAAVRAALPRLSLVTPNLAEARRIGDAGDTANAWSAVDSLLALGARAVLVTGGDAAVESAAPEVVDALAASGREGSPSLRRELRAPRLRSTASHGTGCTLSSAIATRLAGGMPLERAVESARDYVIGAIASGDGFALGSGPDPLDHEWSSRCGGAPQTRCDSSSRPGTGAPFGKPSSA